MPDVESDASRQRAGLRVDRAGLACPLIAGSAVLLAALASLGWVLDREGMGSAIPLPGLPAAIPASELPLAVVAAAACVGLASVVLWNALSLRAAEAAHAAIRRDEGFRFALGELLRESTDPETTLHVVVTRLGEYLGASRCLFDEIDLMRDRATIHPDYHHGLRSVAGTQRFSNYSPENIEDARRGRTVVNHDVRSNPRTAAFAERVYRPLGIGSFVLVPFLEDGIWESTIFVSTTGPRQWQPREIELIAAIGEKTWSWFLHLRWLERLRRSEARKAAILDSAFDAIVSFDDQDTILEVNPAGEEMFGKLRPELLGQSLCELIDVADDCERLRPSLAAREPELRGARCSFSARRADGSRFPVELAIARVAYSPTPLFTAFIRDITELERADRERMRAQQDREDLLVQLRAMNVDLERSVQLRTAELTRALREREILLQEVHHRVKNNLQVVSSLISMQARRLPDASGAAALEECKTRVQAIALIHERLYQSSDYANVPFADYVTALCNNVFLATGVSESSVQLELAIQPLEIGVDRAIPCGLILNELITNALKHAFPDGRPGVVRVEFGREPGGAIAFSVRDDGEGFPLDFDVWKSESMGMQLVCTLVEQLDGELAVSRHGGTCFTVRFGGEG